MKFEVNLPGRKKLIIIGVIISLVIIGIIVFVLRSRSKYQFPTLSSDIPDGPILTDAIQICTNKYRQAIQDGLSDSTPPKSTCIQTAVNVYFQAKCPNIVNGTAPAPGTTAKNYYDAYIGSSSVTGSLSSVSASTEYVGLQVNPPNGVTLDMVVKARKADMTGPTRRYIASACEGFYIPADLPADTAPFTTTYKNWTKLTSAPVSGTTPNYGFYSPYVTGPSVYEWAIKAGVPLSVSTAQPADNSSTNSKNITVSSTVTLAQNDVIKISGVSTVGPLTVSAPVTGATNITINYSPQQLPSIPSGAFVSKSTASPIISSQATTISAAVSVGDPITPTPTNSWVLNLSRALDQSIQVGSQVLLSGTTLTGAVIVSTIGTGRTQVTISFSLQPFPTLPLGATIENVFDIPLATALVATPPVCIVGSAPSLSQSAALTLGSVSVTTGTAVTKFFAITAPAASIPAGTGVKIMTPTYPRIAGGAYTYTVATGGSVVSTGGTGLHVIGLTGNWPAATLPVGAILFMNTTNLLTNNLPITGATSPLYTLYNKMGSLNGTKMLNWQITQLMGPGSFMPNYGAVAQPAWGTS